MYRLLLPLTFVALGVSNAVAENVISSSTNRTIALPMAGRPTGVQEPAVPLTLHAALLFALEANPDLAAARHELQAVDASVMQAGVLPNPALEFSVQDTHRETRETTLQFNQPIELGGKRAARMQAAEHGRNAASAELNAKQAEVRATVISAFFDVLAAQERMRLAQTSTDLAQHATTIASKRVAAGKVSPVEETKARVAESSVRLELNQAKAELAAARKRLAATWSNPTPFFDRAEGQLETLPELPAFTELSARLSTAPAVARARSEVDRRQALAQLESSRRVPDVTVSLGVKRSEELGRNQAIVGVSIPLPLFDSNHGNVLESLRRTEKARDELSATETRLDSDLAQAYEQLNLARQEADALQKEIVPGAQSAYDAAAKGFEFGKFSFLDVLDAQRTLLQAKSQYLRALSEAHRAAAEIDRLLGESSHATKQ
ncbi:TolC family protein [Herbaspirillum sp. ST 5-3]|uniref:TolC family protein n=1 Tax=Oxalobacteraceae TaxID=75682 RepID=UPI0010A43603|nr:TolC family protein [Herbaspirillum sp. ST 5-3]